MPAVEPIILIVGLIALALLVAVAVLVFVRRRR